MALGTAVSSGDSPDVGPTTFAGRGASVQQVRDAGQPRPHGRGRRAGGSRSRTSTRCCTPRPASPKARSSTTTPGSPRCMLPHLAGRPLTLVRLPDGVDGERFFEKRCPGHRPEWVDTVPLDADSDIARLLVDEPARRSCGWPTSPRSSCTPRRPAVDDPWHPTAMVFDLDPGPAGRRRSTAPRRARAARPARPARAARGGEDVGLEGTAPRRSGSGRRSTPTTTKAFALALGQLLESRDPKRVTVDMAKDQRGGQGVRRLEPERPAQDDGVRVLAARHPTTRACRRRSSWDEVARRSSTPATPTRSRSSPPTCSPGRRARRPLRRQPRRRPGAPRPASSREPGASALTGFQRACSRRRAERVDRSSSRYARAEDDGRQRRSCACPPSWSPHEQEARATSSRVTDRPRTSTVDAQR